MCASLPNDSTTKRVHQLSLKEITLAVLTVAVGLLNAYIWREVLFAGEFKEATFYSLPVAALFLFAILFSLASAFIREGLLRNIAAALGLAAGFLMVPFQPVVLSGAALSALGGWYAAGQIANEAEASNYFSVRKILRGGLPVFFTAVALAFAVFYFSLIGGQSDQSLLPKGLFDAVVPLLERPLQKILPGFRSDASVDQLILAVAAQQMGGGIDPSRLPPAERQQLLNEGRKALSVELGILTLTGGEKGIDVLYQAANAQIAKFIGPYRDYLPFIAAFGFFIAVKAFTLPVYWLTLILTAGAVKLLLLIGFLNQKTETIQVTKLTL